jgi:hypothetical protein
MAGPSPCGSSSRQLSRDVGVTVKTGYRMFTEISKALADIPLVSLASNCLLVSAYHIPYLFSNSSKPCFPMPVCKGPNINESVLSTRDDFFSGMTVTLVLSGNFFLKVRPWSDFLPGSQPPFSNK